MTRPAKDWPLLLGADMVLALRAGRKRQTRRLSFRWRSALPRDRLWTRETWAVDRTLDHLPPRALARDVEVEYLADGARRKNRSTFALGKSRPGIFLPRWASRDLATILEVRVQHLHAITDEDAEDEGICALEGQVEDVELYRMAKAIGGTALDPRVWYAVLWEKIHGAGAWALNPELVALTFHRDSSLIAYASATPRAG